MTTHPILDYSKTNYLGQALKLVPIPLVFCHLVILRSTGLFTCRVREIIKLKLKSANFNFLPDLLKVVG